MLSIKGSAAVLTAAFLMLGGRAAQAATVEAKVPFSFLLEGQTMPARRYLVETDGGGVVQIIGEGANRVRIFAMAIPSAGHDPAGDVPSLTFKRDETRYRLSGIWESGTDGLTITSK